MKNRTAIISLLVGCMIFSVFIFTGTNVINRYFENKNDWHFISALIGIFCFAFLLIVSFVGFLAILFKSNKQKHTSV